MKCVIQNFNADYVLGKVVNIKSKPEVFALIDKKHKVVFDVYMQADDFVFYHLFDKSKFSKIFSEVEIVVVGEEKAKRTKKVIPTIINKEPVFDLSPFAPEICSVLYSLRPEVYNGIWDNDKIKLAVNDIVDVAYNGSAEIAKPIHKYFGFLQTMYTKFNSIFKYFPKYNLKSKNPNAIDSYGVLTSPLEMLAIASYLYNLKSHNIDGHFAEFGCFKGFSSSCLSWACFELGIKMDVFDSFCGLPESSSSLYNKGDFSADYQEVKDNVASYGKLDNVIFHKGYFVNTVKEFKETLISFFMDVDLALSANDVLKILPNLNSKSGFFSHESNEDHFINDKVVCPVNENEVINEIILAFKDNNKKISGSFVYGNTGFFEETGHCFPIIPVNEIKTIIMKTRNNNE